MVDKIDVAVDGVFAENGDIGSGKFFEVGGDGWSLEPAPKACRDALSAMGLSWPDAPE